MLIPAIVLLFAVDIKIAGSLSLKVCLPAMLVAFVRYSRDASFTALHRDTGFLLATSRAGSAAMTTTRLSALFSIAVEGLIGATQPLK